MLLYDSVNSFQLDIDKFLFFDIFHKNNCIYIICPVYTVELDKLLLNLNSIIIKYSDDQLKYLSITHKIQYEPIIILKYELISENLINNITVEYKGCVKKYMLYHKITAEKNFLATTTLFKDDYKAIDAFYDYYDKQEYDHYFLYYNGKITREIYDICKKPKITLIEWNFAYWNEDGWKLGIHHHAQPGQIHHALYKYGKDEFTYMSFHDLDEYLHIQNQTIKNYLQTTDLDLIGFRNCWARTLNEPKSHEIPDKIPNIIFVSQNCDEYPTKSKTIYKLDKVTTLNVHNGDKFSSSHINYNVSNIMFHINNWRERGMHDIIYTPYSLTRNVQC